jgi:hypothetical protein
LLLVSWLLVAFIPGLLMLATLGLERLEAGLENDTLTARDVAEFLDQAEPRDVRVLARTGMPEALDGLHRRIADESQYLPSSAEWATDQFRAAATISGPKQPDPTRQPDKHSGANRQFGPRQHANRV